MKKLLLIIAGSFFFALAFAPGRGYAQGALELKVFHSLTCHRCVEIKHEIMPEIADKFRGKVEVRYYDIGEIENYKQLLALEEKYGARIKNDLPVFFCAGYFLNGEGNVKHALSWMIAQAIRHPIPEGGKAAEPIDLVARFKSFEPAAVAGAGLVDGINPCAFTVIVFFISFLSLQGYRRRDLAVIGLTFIGAVFLTYLLIGAGLFTFLYRFKGFWLFAKVFNFAVGLFSIALGFLALYDFFKFKQTGQTEGMALQLPRVIKNRIHAVIGKYYRQPKNSAAAEAPVKTTVSRLAFSALVTGFLVAILELVCTGQVYLPTITLVLKTTPLKAQAFGLLFFYNLMFILPLLVVFLCALLGVTSGQFAAVLKKRFLAVKLAMAVLFFGLGIFLLLGRG